MPSSTLQRASAALAAYLRTALSGVTVFAQWPEPDKKLPAKAISIISSGPRVVEVGATQMQQVTATALTSPPDPANIRRLYTWSLEAWRQSAQLDVWATSFAACDDIISRLDRALKAGLGATIGQINADPWRDGCLVALDPATGPAGFADFSFDGQDDHQSPTQAGHDEWRATFSGECSVNYVETAESARLAAIKLRLKVIESNAAVPTQTFTPLAGGGFTVTTP